MKLTPNRIRRLQLARKWLKTYNGQKIVRGYAPHFGVDKLFAVKELRMLGVKITTEYENALRHSVEDLKKQKTFNNAGKDQSQQWEYGIEGDANFTFIAGYISAGFAYGITHEEMAEIKFEALREGWDKVWVKHLPGSGDDIDLCTGDLQTCLFSEYGNCAEEFEEDDVGNLSIQNDDWNDDDELPF